LCWQPSLYIGCIFHGSQREFFIEYNRFVVGSFGEGKRKAYLLLGLARISLPFPKNGEVGR